jgi:hypothetical protein
MASMAASSGRLASGVMHSDTRSHFDPASMAAHLDVPSKAMHWVHGASVDAASIADKP